MAVVQKIPEYVKKTLEMLEAAGFEAFVVGGCVRDIIIGREPKDWDVTTNARPEKVLALFAEGKYENDFGTVLVPFKDASGKTEAVVEITTYRSEHGYADRRHPDEVKFEDKLDLDLERRDFTINAMALGRITNYELRITNDKTSQSRHSTFDIRQFDKTGTMKIVDLFGGQKDLKEKIIRAVGEPEDRFREDALRMLRAVRFSCELGFTIEPKTERAIGKLAGSIKFIANERIRDELVRILASPSPAEGIDTLDRLKLLNYILPELSSCHGVKQDRHHIYDVYGHSLRSLAATPTTEWQVRLASLLHDIGKVPTRKIINGIATFYNHEYVSERLTRKIVSRLKFSTIDAERITNLVRNHMFYYNVDEVTAASVRRLIAKAGRENLKDLIDLRIADRLGSGVKKAKPYKLRHLEYMFERVQNDPVSVKMLKINGSDIMEWLGMEPGPRIGALLDVLLAEVLEDPARNEAGYLKERALAMKDMDLEQLRAKAKEMIEEKRVEDDKALKKGHYV